MAATKDEEAYVQQTIAEMAKHLHNDGLNYGQIYSAILGELESWFMHISGLAGWWLM